MTAEELRAIRSKINISQVSLSKLLQVHPHTVYQWEAGKRRIPNIVEAALKIIPKRLTVPYRKRIRTHLPNREGSPR